jgi:porin
MTFLSRSVFALLMSGAASAAHAQATDDKPVSPDVSGNITAGTQTPPPATLTGEWGGLRTRLRDGGIDLTLGYTSEAAYNASGGDRQRVRETGQFTFGTALDTDKLIGLPGGTLKVDITYRRGKDLGAGANLGVLQQVQEVYGRGQTWRLTDFYYQQSFANGHVDLKLGRLTQGGDFGAFSCEYMNLSFCGSPPGNLVGDYWYNWPISVWAARLRVKNDNAYFMVGAYEINPRNLDNTFTIGHFHGATGVMVPVAFGYTPRLGAAGLPGSYKLGAWYNSSNADDLLLDINRQPRAVTGLSPLRRDGRYGFYAQFQQQLTGTAEDSPSGRKTTKGLVAFLNVTQADRETSAVDNQIAAGIFYTGLLPFRPHDDFEFAVARTNVNGRSLGALPVGNTRPNAEYAAEIDYGLHATGWLIVRPNVQYVIDPGGYSDRKDVVILGVKSSINF